MKIENNNLHRAVKRRNIVIFGINEEENDATNINLENKVTPLLNQHLHINITAHIEEIRRIGRMTNKPRPVMLSFFDIKTKYTFLSKRTNLKKSGLYIYDDFSKEYQSKRKSMLVTIKTYKEKGINARIIKNKIQIIDSDKKRPRASSDNSPSKVKQSQKLLKPAGSVQNVHPLHNSAKSVVPPVFPQSQRTATNL